MKGVLDPAGPQAAHIAEFWWVMLAACAVVFVAVMIALAWAVLRAPRGDFGAANVHPDARSERRAGRSVAVAVALSAVSLLGLLVASIATDHAIASLPVHDALNVRVTARQWWWDVTYDDPEPTRLFRTANELRIPVGRPVIVTLESADVIHSFWIPALHGKKDLIPGRTSTLHLRADVPGRFAGRCAEFCGLQHAHMDFDVVALPPAEFEAWAEAQRQPAADPSTAGANRGRDLFLSGSCMLCHAVRGTSAGARTAPDLTHVASRPRIAAGLLPNDAGHLAAWILDPQKLKPGANMPAHPINAEELAALVEYLGTLR
jgi:cytochrome c oxidase subunit 2